MSESSLGAGAQLDDDDSDWSGGSRNESTRLDAALGETNVELLLIVGRGAKGGSGRVGSSTYMGIRQHNKCEKIEQTRSYRSSCSWIVDCSTNSKG